MIEASSPWVLARASVRGKSHIDGEIVNQDAMHVASRTGEPCFAVAISDGAGSAKRADEGSQHFSRLIAEGLQQMAMHVHLGKLQGGSHNLVADQINRLVADARASLDVGSDSLRYFHCNLMALALGPKWGVMVYLGDAVMLKSRFERSGEKVDFFVDAGMTAQDRTEYANETHFITEADWTKHLMWNFIDPNGPDDLYALMTDGAADIALGNVPGSGQRRVNRGFFAPLLSMVLGAGDDAERNLIVNSALEDRQTYRITGDDKTMLLVIRRSQLAMSQYEPEMQDQSSLKAELIKENAQPSHAKSAAPVAAATPSLASEPSPKSKLSTEAHESVASAALYSPVDLSPTSASRMSSAVVGGVQLPPGVRVKSGFNQREKLKYVAAGAILMFGILLLSSFIPTVVTWMKNRSTVVGSEEKAAGSASAASEPNKNQEKSPTLGTASKASQPIAAPTVIEASTNSVPSITTTATDTVQAPSILAAEKKTETKPPDAAVKPAKKAASAEATKP